MVQATSCIHVFSDMNIWIDFVIILEMFENFEEAEEVVQKAFDDWWISEDAQCEPIGDWICRCLKEKNIEFEIYSKNDEERSD